LKPYGNAMVHGLVDYKKAEQKAEQITKRKNIPDQRSFEFAKTLVEEIDLKP
jgi:hypothetical protein